MADVRGRLKAEVLLFGFVNTVRLTEGLGHDYFAQLEVLSTQLGQQIEALSPAEREAYEAVAAGSPVPEEFARYGGFALWADDPGLRADAVFTIPEGQTTSQILLTNADLALDERVSDDPLVFANGDVGPTSLFTSPRRRWRRRAPSSRTSPGTWGGARRSPTSRPRTRRIRPPLSRPGSTRSTAPSASICGRS